ncbi:hypothetical protein EV426DRAFT_721746 [Tirmania nivea]|nr:hypothetical protein EV426DRAFT_721746 [Tirmania nivea]
MVFAAVATILSLAWMVYRASVLLKIPIPTLVKLLGLDLPAPPRVSLHGIASDSVTLHWSLPEKPGSVAKHIIHINGINVGESERRGETSVTVTGLNPDHLYNVRVIAANQQNFQAPGQLIRLRTRRKSHDGTEGAGGGSKVKGEHADDSPSIQPHAPVLDAHPAQQQHGHHHNAHGKRAGRERKQASSISEQQQIGSSPVPDEQHTVESLTAELEAVRAEIDELEAQMLHAEEEHKASEGVLVAELDLLREKKRCEDAGRHQLRTETKSLEEAKRVAEAQKIKTEKALKAKEDEIQKMQQESQKWERQRLAALERAELLSKEAEESKGRAESTEKELNVEIIEAQAKISELEEEIRTIFSTIKVIEAEKEQLKVYLGHAASQFSQDEALEKEWLERQKNLEMRYVSVFSAFNLAQEDLNRSREALVFWKTRRDSAPVADTQSIKKLKQRRNRNRKSRTHTLSNSEPPFPMQDPRFLSEAQGFPNQVLQASSFSPSYAANNAPMSYFGSVDDSLNDDRLNGSTLMSPTADSLLPSDLFSSVADPPSPQSHRNSLIESLRFLPQSPMSSGSRSTSHVSSPRSSFHHMPLFPAASEGLGADSDRAAASPMNGLRGRGQPPTETISGTRRIVNLFSFNKQRGKTLPLEPPLLGSLKPAESRSFPQNFAALPSLDPIGTRRRSGSHGSWNLGSMHFLNGKKDIQPDGAEAPKLSHVHHEYPGQEKLFDHSEPVSSRPLSMTSFDGVLPRPSSGVSAAFGWPAEPTSPAKPSRLSMLSTNWSDWSSSRKPPSSLSHNNGNNNASTTSFQSSLSRPSQPRLNPAAPTFESSLVKPSFQSCRDSMSIHDDTSQTDVSSFATADSASGSVLEIVPTKESLFSRLSLSRKGSTSKFNISWKKEGGLFSRGKQKDHPSTVEPGAGEESGELAPENSMFLPLPPIATSERDKTWKKDSFFSRKKGPASDTGDEAEREREKDTPVTAVEPTPTSSPWLKKDGTGFFSRKSKEDREGEKEEKGGKRASMEVGSPAGGKRESFFGKRDKEKGKEREGEKREIVEVNEGGEGCS